MKIKVSELEGDLLDAAVAKCTGEPLRHHDDLGGPYSLSPSTNWRDGGPIIERERIGVWPTDFFIGHLVDGGPRENYCAELREKDRLHPLSFGPSPLIAAMRAFVTSRLGEEVELP